MHDLLVATDWGTYEANHRVETPQPMIHLFVDKESGEYLAFVSSGSGQGDCRMYTGKGAYMQLREDLTIGGDPDTSNDTRSDISLLIEATGFEEEVVIDDDFTHNPLVMEVTGEVAWTRVRPEDYRFQLSEDKKVLVVITQS